MNEQDKLVISALQSRISSLERKVSGMSDDQSGPDLDLTFSPKIDVRPRRIFPNPAIESVWVCENESDLHIEPGTWYPPYTTAKTWECGEIGSEGTVTFEKNGKRRTGIYRVTARVQVKLETNSSNGNYDDSGNPDDTSWIKSFGIAELYWKNGDTKITPTDKETIWYMDGAGYTEQSGDLYTQLYLENIMVCNNDRAEDDRGYVIQDPMIYLQCYNGFNPGSINPAPNGNLWILSTQITLEKIRDL